MLRPQLLSAAVVLAFLPAVAGCGGMAIEAQNPSSPIEQKFQRDVAGAPVSDAPVSTKRLKPEGGFWLQSRSEPGLCLAAQSQNFAPGTTVGLAPCRAVPSQLLFQYAGNFGFGPQACLSAPSELGETITLSPCEFRASKNWGLDGVDDALYAELQLGGSQSLTLTTLALGPADGNDAAQADRPFVLADYNDVLAYPLVIKTPPHVRGQRIFRATNPNLCLTDLHHHVGLQQCNANLRNQIWRLDHHTIRAHDGSCLTLGNGNNTVQMHSCKDTLRQAWELSLGLLMPSALRDGQSVHALDFNQMTDQADIGFDPTTYMGFSIGWPLYSSVGPQR